MRSSLILAGLLVTMTGCSFAARSPDMYRDDTQAALATRTQAINACYNGLLKEDPSLGGQVTLNFEVETEQGQIVNVEVDSEKTTAPDSVTQCVTQNIGGLALSPPDARKGEATWSWSFSAPEG